MSAVGAMADGAGPDVRHGRRILIIWAVANVILVPVVIWVLGPHIPPHNASQQASDQHDVNVVLSALATPVLLMIWVYFGYSIAVFRQRGPEVVDGPPLEGDPRIQVTWLMATTAIVLALAIFFPLFAAGLLGMPRRVSNYNPSLHGLNVFVSISAWCLGLSLLVFLANIVWTQLIVREPAGSNPWLSKSLEWQLPSPVPSYNFERIPVINSAPYSYGIPDAPPVADFGAPARSPGGPAITPEGGVL